jgi:hypothetical protein
LATTPEISEEPHPAAALSRRDSCEHLMDALTRYVDELRADETTVGLLLHGSRALGLKRSDSDSDYDLIRIVTDESYGHRKADGALLETT